jgi:TolA-binding protein
MLYLMGYCLFHLERFAPALEKFGQLVKEYPESAFRESGDYWHALTHLFLTHYEDAAREFLAFNARYPKGPYSEDAAFRVGVAQYGGGEFTAAAASLKKFVEAWPKSALQAEALSMLGDIHASWADLNVAQAYYRQAVGKATSMFQINYATFQSARVYELEQHHEEIIKLFRDYQQRHGEQGNYTEAAYWIGNAQMALGRRAEAWQTFFDAIRDHGNKPANYGIDMIIRDFIAEADQASTLEDRAPFQERLSRELAKARADGRRTLELRLVALFAGTAPTPALRDQLLTTILREENLPLAGPITLDLMAAHARQRGQAALARKINEHFLKHHATCDLALHAYQALAESEIADGKPAAAVPLLQELTSRFATTPEAATAQKRLGDVHRELKQYDLAIAAYQTVLGVKEWRGPLWPESLYGIGLCHLDRGQVAEAFAYFQRLYVLYDGYPEWVARAYLKSGECLEKLARHAEATKTYREMLGKETLAGRPELAAARDALGRLGGGG